MYYRAPTSIHPLAPIKLSSPTLTRITTEIETFNQEQKATTDEYRRLAKLDRPDIRDVTNTSYTQPASHATLDVSGPRVGPGKTETPGAIDEAAQRKDDVDRVLRGESLDETPDVRTQMNRVARKAAAIEVAKEKKQDEFRAEFMKLAAAYCAKLKPEHDAKMKQFFKSFGEAFSIFADLQKTRQDLVDSQIGFSGIYNIDLGFLNSTDVASMFIDAKAAGYVNSIPESLRG
jgi:hypothetical protein